ncbi:MAG: hypothetical protein B6D40_07230 [Anaerolineae bacterium UTCFX3]|nr:MAG: hypothetical protein B6D40_07230 [Anaerolineae bacterium UTCFX3]
MSVSNGAISVANPEACVTNDPACVANAAAALAVSLAWSSGRVTVWHAIKSRHLCFGREGREFHKKSWKICAHS